jgi:hypothetical protein
MTHRAEIEALAAKVGADVYTDASGKISRVSWGWNKYGEGCLFSLLCFAEKARAA